MDKKKVVIQAGSVKTMATLNGTETAEAIWNALPIEGAAQTWGDEIYFSVPLALPEERAQEVVEIGDLAYWPPGRALCIFFGLTPMSRGNEIRPAGPVNVIGKVAGDPSIFQGVDAGTRVMINRTDVD